MQYYSTLSISFLGQPNDVSKQNKTKLILLIGILFIFYQMEEIFVWVEMYAGINFGILVGRHLTLVRYVEIIFYVHVCVCVFSKNSLLCSHVFFWSGQH